MRYGVRLFVLILVVAAFLGIRKWIDRKMEKAQNIEIVREDRDEGDAHLGLWALKNTEYIILLRLKRDGSFSYEIVQYPTADTSRYTGVYEIIPAAGYGNRSDPRLVAVSNHGDTIIHHFVYLTRASQRNVDILNLKKNNHPDAPVLLFYRIKQQTLY